MWMPTSTCPTFNNIECSIFKQHEKNIKDLEEITDDMNTLIFTDFNKKQSALISVIRVNCSRSIPPVR